MVNRAFSALLVVGSCVSQSFGQTEPVADAYLVYGSNEQPKIVFQQTGIAAPVVGQYASAPSICPDGAFWVNNNVAVESCKGGEKYKSAAGFLPNLPNDKAIPLQLIGKPGGTDKPPPMRSEPPSDGKTVQ